MKYIYIPLRKAGIELEEIASLQAFIAALVTSCLFVSIFQLNISTDKKKKKIKIEKDELPMLIITNSHFNKQ